MSSLPCITLQHLMINNERKIGLKFYPNPIIQDKIRQLPHVKWSKANNIIVIPNNQKALQAIYSNFRGIAYINGKYFFKNKVNKRSSPKVSLDKLRDCRKDKNYKKCPDIYIQTLEIRRYSLNTAKTYIACFEKFINYYKNSPLKTLTEVEINGFLNYLNSKNYSASYLNVAINSIKFYYEIVLDMPNRFFNIGRPRKRETLPKVISKEEVMLIINNTNNIKHKCIVSLLYSAGLRRSELLNLKLTDIDSKRMVILIKNAKGGKDRNGILSPILLQDLREYFKKWRPKEYLFEGPNHNQYSGRSVAKIIGNACKKAKILKTVTPHTLRHSFATHLLEGGTNLRYIQALLGHSSTRTTEIYTHVAINNIQNIKSPLDSLF